MFTTNYWNYKAFIESQNITNGEAWTKVDLGLKGLDNATVLFQKNRSDSAAQYYAVYSTLGIRSGLGVIVGVGTTAPTIGDYALGSDVTHLFINTSISNITGVDGEAGIKTVLTFKGTNNSSDLTITEYGITKAINSGNSSTTPVLILHELLPDPIVVESGHSFVLPIEWKEF